MRYKHLSNNENDLLNRVNMWGSDGYPVYKIGSKWSWSFRNIQGPPVLYRTKRGAVAAFEAYYDVLLDRAAKRIA